VAKKLHDQSFHWEFGSGEITAIGREERDARPFWCIIQVLCLLPARRSVARRVRRLAVCRSRPSAPLQGAPNQNPTAAENPENRTTVRYAQRRDHRSWLILEEIFFKESKIFPSAAKIAASG